MPPEFKKVHLMVGRLVLETRLLENGFNLVFVEDGDADSFDQPSIHQLFHGLQDKAKTPISIEQLSMVVSKSTAVLLSQSVQ